MTLTLGMITLDTTDPSPLAAWWSAQTGATVEEEHDGWFVVLQLPGGPRLAFQKVDDPTPGKNRVHLDLGAASGDLDAEVERLVDAGATLVAERSMGDFRWVTLADPDGNQFCVAEH
ncbi:VOC family protein [Nocardioides zeae]